MDENIFTFHVNGRRNDFARWVNVAFGDRELSGALYKTNSKAAMARIVKAKIDFLGAKSRQYADIESKGIERQNVDSLFEYIERSRKSGVSNREIYTALGSAGWKEEHIIEALYGATKPVSTELTDLPDPEVQNRLRISQYIFSSLKMKVHKDRIVENLLKAGWPLDMVREEMRKYFK